MNEKTLITLSDQRVLKTRWSKEYVGDLIADLDFIWLPIVECFRNDRSYEIEKTILVNKSHIVTVEEKKD